MATSALERLAQTAKRLRELLSYPPGTAGALMDTQIATLATPVPRLWRW